MKNSRFVCKAVVSAAAVLAGLLTGCTTYVAAPPPPPAQPVYVAPPPPQPVVEVVPTAPPPVYVSPAAPDQGIVMQAASDFYEPLQAYGQWIDVPGYGRCWTPANVDATWRPYTDGHWERTDAGWYWVSDERWGWATYHYGRWHSDAHFGWVWVPQTQWAPAWVAWRDGGGYTGWAPLPPEARFGPGQAFQFRDQDLDQHAFVFVRQEQMLEPHRHQDVIVNNVSIINKTVNITQIRVVNNTVVSDGPRPEAVARETGHKVEAVPVRTLRGQQEAHVVMKPNGPAGVDHRAAAPNGNPPHGPGVSNPVKPTVTHVEPPPNHPPTEPVKPVSQPARPVTEPEQARKVAPGQAKPGVAAQTDAAAGNRREVNRPGTQPGQPPKTGVPPTGRPQDHVANQPSAVPGHEAKAPGTSALTPQQKLQQEKTQKANEKRRVDQQKGGHSSSTNAPAGPH